MQLYLVAAEAAGRIRKREQRAGELIEAALREPHTLDTFLMAATGEPPVGVPARATPTPCADD